MFGHFGFYEMHVQKCALQNQLLLKCFGRYMKYQHADITGSLMDSLGRTATFSHHTLLQSGYRQIQLLVTSRVITLTMLISERNKCITWWQRSSEHLLEHLIITFYFSRRKKNAAVFSTAWCSFRLCHVVNGHTAFWNDPTNNTHIILVIIKIFNCTHIIL